jgi:hypothetical protein
MFTKNISEKGQAIVLLVVSIVVLLGFTALALDGGMVYSDRRAAQNAADTASLAGAATVGDQLRLVEIAYQNWNCDNIIYAVEDEAKDAAINRAATNNYVIDEDISDRNGVEIICVDTPNGLFYNRYVDVKAAIEAETRTSFAQIITNQPLVNNVEAVTRVNSAYPLGLGQALVALNMDDCSGNQNGLIFGGNVGGGSEENPAVSIRGGGALTNCCLYGRGSSYAVTAPDGGVHYACSDQALGTLTGIVPAPEYTTQTIPPNSYNLLPEPTCSTAGSRELIATRTWRYQPGSYSSIDVSNNETHFLEPGLYCLPDGRDVLKVNGGNLYGYGVTIFIDGGNRVETAVSITGGENVRLAAPCTDADITENSRDLDICDDPEGTYPVEALPYVLIYATGNKEISITGNANSLYQGSIYAPEGDVKLRGTGDTVTFNTQIIAKNISLLGNARLNIEFDSNRTFQFPAALNALE